MINEMQSSFSELEYAAKKRVTRRDRFLAEIEAVTPWLSLTDVIAPHYPSGGGPGRPPVGLERMLRNNASAFRKRQPKMRFTTVRLFAVLSA